MINEIVYIFIRTFFFFRHSHTYHNHNHRHCCWNDIIKHDFYYTMYIAKYGRHCDFRHAFSHQTIHPFVHPFSVRPDYYYYCYCCVKSFLIVVCVPCPRGKRTEEKSFRRNIFSFWTKKTTTTITTTTAKTTTQVQLSWVSQKLHLSHMYIVSNVIWYKMSNSYFVRISLTKWSACRILLT